MYTKASGRVLVFAYGECFDELTLLGFVNIKDESKILNKKVKAKLVLTKLRELGYKKVILNKDTYNYLENSFDKYKIISIENADDYMLEL